MPKPYVPVFDPLNIPPELAEFIKNFKIKPNVFKPQPKIRSHRIKMKVKIKKHVTLDKSQLTKLAKSKTLVGAQNAIGMKGGTRAILDIKKNLIERLSKTSYRIENRSFQKYSTKRRMTEALAEHFAGETIEDAALRYGLEPHRLANFKRLFLKVDSALPQYVEELFLQGAVKCMGIFTDKSDTLTAMQALIGAKIMAEGAITIKKARTVNYMPDELPLSSLQKLSEVMDKLNAQKRLGAKTIDTEIEIKQIEE